MYRTIIGLFFFITSSRLDAQILPKEGSKLNYRIMGFSFPQKHAGSKYKIEIATGHYNTEDSFKKNIITSFFADTNRIIGEVPAFGKQYTWQAVVINKNSGKTKSELHHFSTLIIPEVDTSINRLRIIKCADKYQDAYIFLDNLKTLYDMNGVPVWFLPDSLPDIYELITNPIDLKISPFGTITFLFGGGIYEISYNGNVLWNGPNNYIGNKDRKVHDFTYYHHEFTRLSNGHYMTLGSQMLLCKRPTLKDSSFFIVSENDTCKSNDTTYRKLEIGTLIEYDKRGNTIWKWTAAKYIKESDLFYCGVRNGMVKQILHDNSFYFDEEHKTIYISFRNISRVIKVKYPEGTVLNTYGEIYKPGVEEKGNGFFCNQHACRLTRKGYLYLYNNNDCDTGALPSIVMMQEPLYPKDTLKKIWEYKCTMNDDARIHIKNSWRQGGGNVIELPDSSIFACMGYNYGKLFIVSMDKKITWSAMAEKWNPDEKKWDMHPSYRASIINRKEMEHLVWNEGIKE